jgi:hypothetical protein
MLSFSTTLRCIRLVTQSLRFATSRRKSVGPWLHAYYCMLQSLRFGNFGVNEIEGDGYH